MRPGVGRTRRFARLRLRRHFALALGEHDFQRLLELQLRLPERHAVLRPLGPGEARFDGGQIELHCLGVDRIGRRGRPEQSLLLRVRFDQPDARFVASRQPQVVERHLVDGANRDRRAVLWRHVPQRRAIGDGQELEAGPIELDELADDANLAQAFGDRQHEVRGRGTFRQTVRQAEADDLRNQHGDRLTEHGRLGLDAAHAPADDAETVDHRGVRVRADQRVWIRELLPAVQLVEHHARQVFEVHLVDDARVGRDDAEVVECRLTPPEQRVAFLVARELELRVQLEGVALGEVIDLHRVIDHQLHRLERVDALRIAAQPRDAVTHGGQIDNGRDAGEVLQQHPRGHERDLLLRLRRDVPLRQRLDVVAIDETSVFASQQVLEQDLERERQPREPGETGLFERRKAVDLVGVGPHPEGHTRLERIL